MAITIRHISRPNRKQQLFCLLMFLACTNLVHAQANDYIIENPYKTRYFWATNGFALEPGTGYFQNSLFFFNHMALGVTPHASIGIGAVPLFLVDTDLPFPAWVTPRINVPITGSGGRLRLGMGAMFATVFNEDQGSIGLGYVSLTYGSHDANVSAGLGYGITGNLWKHQPTLNISGMLRVGEHMYFLTENYWLNTTSNELGVFAAGLRTVRNERIFDFGFLYMTEEIYYLQLIPWVGMTILMGSG